MKTKSLNFSGIKLGNCHTATVNNKLIETIDTKNLQPGIYYLSITYDNHTYTNKVVTILNHN